MVLFPVCSSVRWTFQLLVVGILLLSSACFGEKGNEAVANSVSRLQFIPYMDNQVSLLMPKGWLLDQQDKQLVVKSPDHKVTVTLNRRENFQKLENKMREATGTESLPMVRERKFPKALYHEYAGQQTTKAFFITDADKEGEYYTMAIMETDLQSSKRLQGEYFLAVLASTFRLSTEPMAVEVKSHKHMPGFDKVGYSKAQFAHFVGLLEFCVGRSLTQQEKIALVESDYLSAQGGLEKYQANIKQTVAMLMTMWAEIEKVKEETYAVIVRQYLQQFFLSKYAANPMRPGNALGMALMLEDYLPVESAAKKLETLPAEFNKHSVVADAIGYASANLVKLKKSRWAQQLNQELQTRKQDAVVNLSRLFGFMANTRGTGIIESWNKQQRTNVVYAPADENILSLYGKYKDLGNQHYKVNNGKLDLYITPWGYIRYDRIAVRDTFDIASPIYLLDTTDIETGYQYLLNLGYTVNIGFDLSKSLDPMHKQMMAHIKRIRLSIDGDKTADINFALWFDHDDYAKAFLALVQLKKAQIHRHYEYISIDEWLLNQLELERDGARVSIKQRFDKRTTVVFVTKLAEEIQRYRKDKYKNILDMDQYRELMIEIQRFDFINNTLPHFLP